MRLMKLWEVLAIVAVVSFVLLIFGKGIYDFLHGKSSCANCHGNCKNCSSDATETKNKLKQYLDESYK